MVVMDVKINNFFSFQHFHINFSYPKKILHSPLEGESLSGHERFRYKKVNILMGTNATGKTTFGKCLMNVFNFIFTKDISHITHMIDDSTKESELVVDFVVEPNNLYRLAISTIGKKQREVPSVDDLDVRVMCTTIGKMESYELCARRLDSQNLIKEENYAKELDKIPWFGWHFIFPEKEIENLHWFENNKYFISILRNTLQVLDPAIISVDKVRDVESTYAIRFPTRSEIIKNGFFEKDSSLSSGTRAGINIAMFVASMAVGRPGLYYCDEKFSYVHSDIEKAFLSIMIDQLKENEQLFFTTHNTDILDLQLPKHSFTFLKKSTEDTNVPIKCVSASDYLKKSSDSLRRAVENDLFSIAPEVEKIYEILQIGQRRPAS